MILLGWCAQSAGPEEKIKKQARNEKILKKTTSQQTTSAAIWPTHLVPNSDLMLWQHNDEETVQ